MLVKWSPSQQFYKVVILDMCLLIASDFSGFSADFFLFLSSGARGNMLGGVFLS